MWLGSQSYLSRHVDFQFSQYYLLETVFSLKWSSGHIWRVYLWVLLYSLWYYLIRIGLFYFLHGYCWYIDLWTTQYSDFVSCNLDWTPLLFYFVSVCRVGVSYIFCNWSCQHFDFFLSDVDVLHFFVFGNRPSSILRITGAENRCSFLVPDFGGKAVAFLPLIVLWLWHFHIMHAEHSSVPHLLHRKMLTSDFLVAIQMITRFFFHILNVAYTTPWLWVWNHCF